MEQSNEKMRITVKSTSFNMIKVQGGTFWMGADNGVTRTGRWFFRRKTVNRKVQNFDPQATPNEKPVHPVTLKDFYIGETVVTYDLWKELTGETPCRSFGDHGFPVLNVDWNECVDFIRQLNEYTGMEFRMPTEAEWEYAARGGQMSRGYKYAGSNDIDEVAWYNKNCTNPDKVMMKAPNELGIYDMSGNLYEWCEDIYVDYDNFPRRNPRFYGDETDSHILRGGSFSSSASECRVTARAGCYPRFQEDVIHLNIGLRLALS